MTCPAMAWLKVLPTFAVNPSFVATATVAVYDPADSLSPAGVQVLVLVVVSGAVWQTCRSVWYRRFLWWLARTIFFGATWGLLFVADTGQAALSWVKLLAWFLEVCIRVALSCVGWVGWASQRRERLVLACGAFSIEECVSDDMVPRRFFVVRGEPDRPNEWDEYNVLAGGDSADRWVCFSTD